MVAEITRVATEYTVAVDVSRMFGPRGEEPQEVDLASVFALVGSLAEEGYTAVLWRELIGIRDTSRAQLSTLQNKLGPGSVVAAGVAALTDEERSGG